MLREASESIAPYSHLKHRKRAKRRGDSGVTKFTASSQELMVGLVQSYIKKKRKNAIFMKLILAENISIV